MYRIIGGDQKEYGPATADELRRWIEEGRLSGQSLILAEGGTEWKPVASFPEFADALAAQAARRGVAAGPLAAVASANWPEQVLAQAPELQVGRCLAQGWNLLMANFGLFFAATFLVWAVELCELIPALGIVAWLLHGVFYGGLCRVVLHRLRGQPAAVGDGFDGFRTGFPQLLLAGFLTSLLAKLGLIFCVLPGLFLFVAWTFSVPLVADKGLEFWPAMELSRKVVSRVWFQMLGLTALVFAPFMLAYVFVQIKISVELWAAVQPALNAGQPDVQRMMQIITQMVWSTLPLVLLTKFVLLLCLPLAVSALMCAYEALFGPRPAGKP